MTATLFLATTLLAVGLFYWATGKNKRVLITALLWLTIVGICAIIGFFQSNPKRFILVIGTAVTLTVLCFRYIKPVRVNMMLLLSIHTLRVPVEFVLYQLYLQKKIPLLMTFHGWNYDILIGLSAIVFVTYQWLTKRALGQRLFRTWNLIGLLFLTVIVVLAILSAPLPIQQLAFDQPNVAVLTFPYCFLPAIVVPIVYLSHLLTIKKIANTNGSIMKP